MKIYLQSSVDFLIEKSVTDFQARPASSGALATKTGLFTGRSPKDRFIVQDTATQETVWWGDINLPLQTTHFEALEKELLHFLTTIETYKRQSFVGADPRFRLAVETRVEKPWKNDAAYYATAHRLAKAFHKNFMPFEKDVEKDIKKGGPIEV